MKSKTIWSWKYDKNNTYYMDAQYNFYNRNHSKEHLESLDKVKEKLKEAKDFDKYIELMTLMDEEVSNIKAVYKTENKKLLYSDNSKVYDNLKTILVKLREKINTKLLENKHSIQGIYESISPDQCFHSNEKEQYKGEVDYKIRLPVSLSGILATAYQQAEYELKNLGIKKSCDYAIMGLGSMALQQATSYSDLEFAIIIEKKDDKEGSIKQYFKTLTQFVESQIIALGETYQEGVNKKKGICFDTWNKTPYGKEGKYELIQTKEEFIKDLKNKNNETVEKKDILLHAMLANTCFVYGKEALHKEYRKEAGEWLGHKDHQDKSNMFDKMLVVDRKIGLDKDDFKNEKKVGAAEPVLLRNEKLIDSLNDKIKKKEFHKIDIKQEIYRPIETLIINYSGDHGWFNESMFQLPHRLYDGHKKDTISKKLFDSLSMMVKFIGKLRLEHCEYYQGRQELFLGKDFLKEHPNYQKELESYGHNISELLGAVDESGFL